MSEAPQSAVDAMLAEARRTLERVEPEDLAAEVEAGALVVDIRPEANRRDEGPLPGAVVLDRNVLEWRLDPTSPHRISEADDAGRRVILVCNEGYASSLAAAALQQLGLPRATDLAGGYRAWLTRVEPSP
ncbi:MAG TPA: rhodanese-like domain-containing protein [Acidimicrobiales bacterium]|nr:rhodanese-like domain-containing protein [Acidimicrobiales bacterium]